MIPTSEADRRWANSARSSSPVTALRAPTEKRPPSVAATSSSSRTGSSSRSSRRAQLRTAPVGTVAPPCSANCHPPSALLSRSVSSRSARSTSTRYGFPPAHCDRCRCAAGGTSPGPTSRHAAAMSRTAASPSGPSSLNEAVLRSSAARARSSAGPGSGRSVPTRRTGSSATLSTTYSTTAIVSVSESCRSSSRITQPRSRPSTASNLSSASASSTSEIAYPGAPAPARHSGTSPANAGR